MLKYFQFFKRIKRALCKRVYMSVCDPSSYNLESWKHKEVAVDSRMRKLCDSSQKTEIVSFVCSMPEKSAYFYLKYSMIKGI